MLPRLIQMDLAEDSVRPTFLIIEVESSEGISSRKLVVEIAKLNVLTAYSGREGLELFAKFPAVDAVVVHHGMQDIRCENIIAELKRLRPSIPVVLLAPDHNYTCPADYVVSMHEPQNLLELLQRIAQSTSGA